MSCMSCMYICIYVYMYVRNRSRSRCPRVSSRRCQEVVMGLIDVWMVRQGKAIQASEDGVRDL